MKLYIVFDDCGYDGNFLEAVFASEDEAEAFIARKTPARPRLDLFIEEWELGKERE